MKKGITVHMMVKNEERFVSSAIEAILPVAQKVIVFDTGSTDSTLEKIKSLKSRKLEVFEKGLQSPEGLVKLRNEMVGLTKTEWFFVVDGDEIFYFREPAGLLGKLEALPKGIHRVELTLRDFVNDASLVARDRVSGKIWRTHGMRFKGKYPFEYGEPRGWDVSQYMEFSSDCLKGEAVCYHMVYFKRSGKDSDVKVGRHWRKMPFPVLPFFGPYPEGFPIRQNIIASIPKFFIYNIVGLFHALFHKKEEKRDVHGNG